MKYLLKISFLGGGFAGFQFQPNRRTVQGVLTDAFSTLFGCDCAVTGCSRTDSGVHANEFCITVEPLSDKANLIPPESLPVAAAHKMPDDIAVKWATEVPADFHPRYDAKGKEYVYKILYSRTPDPFLKGRAWRIPGNIRNIDIASMNRAASNIVGTQDFASFMATGSKITDSIRTVYSCSVEKDGDLLAIRISADGFLYNMVRIIAGTLSEVGAGKRSADSVSDLILSRDRRLAGRTAPPEGLYLNRVFYDGEISKRATE